MRIFLTLWFIPLAFFWGWYGLSANDISFGTAFLSRDLHDIVFKIYADMLGMEPEVIPGVIAAACAFDTAIVMGVAAIKWRASWYPQFKATLNAFWHEEVSSGTDTKEISAEYSLIGQAHPAE